jgi:hypothetical protein
VFGTAGSNDCPAGSVRIIDETACRNAAVAAGKTAALGFVETNSIYPKGCYYDSITDAAALNNHATGASNPRTLLLCCDGCTAAPTGAPPLASPR